MSSGRSSPSRGWAGCGGGWASRSTKIHLGTRDVSGRAEPAAEFAVEDQRPVGRAAPDAAGGRIGTGALRAGRCAVLKLAKLPVRPSAVADPSQYRQSRPADRLLRLGEPAMPYAIAFSTLVQVSHFTVGIWLASGQLSWRTVLISPPLWSLLLALIAGPERRCPAGCWT